jgi:GNS1/SUR4 family
MFSVGKDFSWSTAPANKIDYVIFATASYLLVIAMHTLLTRVATTDNTPLKYGSYDLVQKIHNIILSAGSFVMFICCTYEVYNRSVRDNSIVWLFCENEDNVVQGSLWYWSYIYYLSKYYELFDTILQLLQGKIPPNYFLHVYHHSCVIFMGWIWLESGASIQFIGLLFNCFVHIIMYYYFYLKSIGVNPWWKKYGKEEHTINYINALNLFLLLL